MFVVRGTMRLIPRVPRAGNKNGATPRLYTHREFHQWRTEAVISPDERLGKNSVRKLEYVSWLGNTIVVWKVGHAVKNVARWISIDEYSMNRDDARVYEITTTYQECERVSAFFSSSFGIFSPLVPFSPPSTCSLRRDDPFLPHHQFLRKKLLACAT